MTRFARAKGSKASNERIPENATPWKVMKEEMERKKQEAEDNKERAKLNKVRQENYDKFLKEQVNETKTQWAEFPDDGTTPKKQKLKTPIQKKKEKKKNAEKMISKKEILDMLKPDPKIDAQVDDLKSKIVKVLDKTEIKKNVDKTPKKKKAPEANKENNDDSAPVEVSSKVEPKTVVVGKKKQKKTPLKIPKTKEEENNKEVVPDTEKPTTELTKSMKKRLKRKKQIAAKKKFNETEGNTKPDLKKKNNKSKQPKNNKQNKNEQNSNKKDNETSFNNSRQGFKRKNPNENPYEKPDKFPKKEQKLKVAKVRDNKKREEHPRRKPEEGPVKMIFNGKEVEVIKFDGFPVKKDDAERLAELKKQMISKGIPRSEVQRTLKLERRKAEKSLTREKKKVCFNCRKAGHMLSECPELNSGQVDESGSGICFKCGSTEHTHFECKVQKGEEFKFAKCFICREQGHIAKQCPDNPKGLYPQGGACKLCGDVTHLKKDCPRNQQEKEENALFLKTISGGNIEGIEDDLSKTPKPSPVKNKVVKF